jgi:gluconate 2-dehydrogenase gamma chain
MNSDTGDIDRRTFLRRFALLSGMLAACPLPVLAELRERSGSAAQTDAQAMGEPWQTLDAVQRHLFPAGQATPGAADIGALAYLRNAIDNPDADGEDRTFVVNGVGWLNELTQEQYQRSFVELDQAQRETVLRRIEQSRAGRNWLSLVLTYVLEALLADPVYGGNPGGTGWAWLEHQPGYPAPPPDKLWYRLGRPVEYRRKAT